MTLSSVLERVEAPPKVQHFHVIWGLSTGLTTHNVRYDDPAKATTTFFNVYRVLLEKESKNMKNAVEEEARVYTDLCNEDDKIFSAMNTAFFVAVLHCSETNCKVALWN